MKQKEEQIQITIPLSTNEIDEEKEKKQKEKDKEDNEKIKNFKYAPPSARKRFKKFAFICFLFQKIYGIMKG